MVEIPIPLGGATGPSGPTGPQGLPGGATGVIAPAGLVGLPGPTGVLGVTGVQGATGPPAPGPTGPVGVTGPEGVLGLNGDVGVTGDTGVDGDVGPIGLDGPLGVTGPIGSTGGVGATGAQGAIGVTGPTGAAGGGLGTSIFFIATKPTISGSQTIPGGGGSPPVLVTFPTTLFSSGVSFIGTTTIKILTAGLYIFTANLEWGAVGGFDFAADTTVRTRIVKNQAGLGSLAINSGNNSYVIGPLANSGFDYRSSVSIMDVAAVDDEYEVYVFHNQTTGPPFNASLDRDCHFTCVGVGT